MRRGVLFAVVFALIILSGLALALYANSLTFKIQKAAWGKHCRVFVAVTSKYGVFKFNNKKVPLLSVFKYFVAAAALNKIEDEGKSLNHTVFVKENMVDKNAYSPMLRRYSTPFKISIGELIRYMVSESDNNATDILIDYIGGMQKFQKELKRYQFPSVSISANEKMMGADINNQYLNKATPLSVIEAMQLFRGKGSHTYILHPLQRHDKVCLTDEHQKFLDKIMIETITGENKIKAGLPKDVVFGHKTGSSSRKPNGVKIADNDAGFVILPNGVIYYIAVFVTESKMSDDENAALIAQISKIIYEYIMAKSQE